MVKQYLAIRPFLSNAPWNALNAIVELLPSPLQELRLNGLFEELKTFEMVSKGLQKTENTLYDARYALNFLGEKHPSILSKVGVNFTDYRWRAFESAIVKVQGNQEAQLNEAEKVALEPFLINPQIIEVIEHEEGGVGSYEALMKKARREIPVIQSSKYINTLFVKADTNICERLFSISRKIWREDRKAMNTSTFELVMLLKCNRELWDERLVYKCRTNPRRRPPPVALLAAPPAVAQAAVPVVAQVVPAVVAQAVPAVVAPAVPAVVAPAVAEVGVLAAAELAAFIADLDAIDMNGHNNVFLRNGIEAAVEEYEGDEEEEEEDDNDDDKED